MELFAVNRYAVEEAKKPEPQQQDDILSNLLEKVEKRKRARNKTKHESEKAINTTESKEKPETTKKKPKKSETVDNDAIEVEEIVNDKSEINEKENQYEVLGEDGQTAAKRRSQKSDFVLPPWLAHPTIISTCLADGNSAEGTELKDQYPYLAPHIIQSLKELQVKNLFPVQSAVIPWILQAHEKPMPFRPRDICVSAPTGSGKTLAFAVPVVQVLAANRVQRKVRALVVLPVVELAAQVYKVFKKLCEKTDLSVVFFSQNTSFAVEQNNLIDFYKGVYYSKADIVVTTPGRLVDHLHATRGFCLKSLKFLIIDEADRIMDAVFQNWFYHLDTHVRNTSDQLLSGRTAPLSYVELVHSAATQPHKLLFSATLSQDPEKLQNMRLFQPKLFTSVLRDVDVLRNHFTAAAESNEDKISNENRTGDFIGKYTTPAELTEKICITEPNLKPLTLYTLIQEQRWRKFLCFTNSADAAHRLVFVLNYIGGSTKIAAELSGNLKHSEREKCLSAFARGNSVGLVCSDAMARGIDVDVDVVFSYDPPRHIKTYIHRIGRTARAGRSGTAVTLLSTEEQKDFNKILSEVGKHVTDEISVSTVNEEKNATRFARALKFLRKKITADKNRKIAAKRSAQSLKPPETFDPASMTLMEKLQAAVNTAVVNKTLATSTKDEEEKVSRRIKKHKQKGRKGQ